jgi:hypothetical protein
MNMDGHSILSHRVTCSHSSDNSGRVSGAPGEVAGGIRFIFKRDYSCKAFFRRSSGVAKRRHQQIFSPHFGQNDLWGTLGRKNSRSHLPHHHTSTWVYFVLCMYSPPPLATPPRG